MFLSISISFLDLNLHQTIFYSFTAMIAFQGQERSPWNMRLDKDFYNNFATKTRIYSLSYSSQSTDGILPSNKAINTIPYGKTDLRFQQRAR